MARIKFSIFVVACTALGFAGLMNLSSGSAALSQQQITERLAWGEVLFETSGHLAQSYRTAALVTASGDAALAQAVAGLEGAAPGAPTATAARKAVAAAFEKLPEALRGAPVVLVGNDKGVAMLAGEGTETKLLDGAAFSLAAAARSAAGAYAAVDGKLYRVAAVPLRAGDKTVGVLGAAVALDDAFAAQEAKGLAMGVTLVAGKTVLSSLPAEQRSIAAEAQDGPVALGELASFGPIGLPMFAGLTAPAQARTFALEGVEGGRVVITAENAGLAQLADFQKRALLGLTALIALGLAFIALLAPKATGARADPEARTEPLPAEPVAPAAEASAQPEAAAEPFPGPAATTEPAADPHGNLETQPTLEAQPEPVSEAQLEPLPADAAPAEAAPEPQPAPAAELFAPQEPAPEPVQPEAAAAAPQPEPAPEPAPLPAAPAYEPPPAPAPSPFGGSADAFAEKPFDPFAAAAAQQAYEEEQREPERTVVAAVPEQLLRAAARARSPVAPLTTPVAIPLPAPSQPAPTNAEEAHFQDVFKQFLATRAQCNEPSDGLTFDKFAAKLRKNKEQLVAKYSCKSVRFQVYTKDGKAALKATPIKD